MSSSVLVVDPAVKIGVTFPSSLARCSRPSLANANTGLSRPLGTMAIVYFLDGTSPPNDFRVHSGAVARAPAVAPVSLRN